MSLVQSSYVCFSKVKLVSIVMPRTFLLELLSIKELLILKYFALNDNKNKQHFEAFGLIFIVAEPIE